MSRMPGRSCLLRTFRPIDIEPEKELRNIKSSKNGLPESNEQPKTFLHLLRPSKKEKTERCESEEREQSFETEIIPDRRFFPIPESERKPEDLQQAENTPQPKRFSRLLRPSKKAKFERCESEEQEQSCETEIIPDRRFFPIPESEEKHEDLQPRESTLQPKMFSRLLRPSKKAKFERCESEDQPEQSFDAEVLPGKRSDDAPEDSCRQSDDTPKTPTDFQQAFDKLGPSIYFVDGIRKIDYVLVFHETLEEYRRRNGGDGVEEMSKKERWRMRFLFNLQETGLQTEEEVVFQGKKVSVYIKVHATWPVLCNFAEELNMRAPLMLKTEPSDLTNGSQTLLEYLGFPNPMKLIMPNQPLHFYTCPFRKYKMARFLGSTNRETYFTTIQRIKIVHEVLSSAVFGKQKKGEVGIERLVHEGVFVAAYPLHDGPYKADNNCEENEMNPRQILYEYWARWRRWYKYQPLDHIRNYFGEKVGMYFAWLGFYTFWLFPAAVVGILVFLFGLITVFDNQFANDVCERPGKYKMCPQHELGRFWDLYDICTYLRISYLFDHPGSVFYSIFISFWAVAFLEYWKRKCATIAYQWDCTDFQGEEEKPRAEYAAKAPYIAVNPVTGVKEPMFPSKQRGKRIATGLGLIFVMISVVVIFIFAIIVFRIAVAIPLHSMNMTRTYAHTMANLSGAGLNFFLIMMMSKLYEGLARRLTHWEMHRTQSEYDDNYTFKVFVFQFVNFYSSIFYIAFFKGRFVGYPGNYVYVFNMRNEECEEGGCLIELAQQLAIIMIGKQVINNVMEIGIPWAKSWWLRIGSSRNKDSQTSSSQVHADYYTSPNDGLFEEYLEMVLQFGFITLFVAAFPLAPLFALLNNWVEIRLDAQKFVCHTRRGVPERSGDIGMWFRILQYLAHIAVITNGLLIAFTSRFLMKLLYQYEYNWSGEGYYDFILSKAPNGTYNETCRYRGQRDENGNYTMFFWKLLAVQFAFVLAFEYVVFTVCRLIDIFVSDVPASVDIKIRRERYLAKQALLDNDLFKPEERSVNAESSRGSHEEVSSSRRSNRKRLKRQKTNVKPDSAKIKTSFSEYLIPKDTESRYQSSASMDCFIHYGTMDSAARPYQIKETSEKQTQTETASPFPLRAEPVARRRRPVSCLLPESGSRPVRALFRRSYPHAPLSNTSSRSDVFLQFPDSGDETDSCSLSSSS